MSGPPENRRWEHYSARDAKRDNSSRNSGSVVAAAAALRCFAAAGESGFEGVSEGTGNSGTVFTTSWVSGSGQNAAAHASNRDCSVRSLAATAGWPVTSTSTSERTLATQNHVAHGSGSWRRNPESSRRKSAARSISECNEGERA